MKNLFRELAERIKEWDSNGYSRFVSPPWHYDDLDKSKIIVAGVGNSNIVSELSSSEAAKPGIVHLMVSKDEELRASIESVDLYGPASKKVSGRFKDRVARALIRDIEDAFVRARQSAARLDELKKDLVK